MDITKKENFIEVFKLKEASIDPKSGSGRILIIEEGFNVSKSRFYTKEALEKAVSLFSGKKMYVNHE